MTEYEKYMRQLKLNNAVAWIVVGLLVAGICVAFASLV
jgi:hypothetical protein